MLDGVNKGGKDVYVSSAKSYLKSGSAETHIEEYLRRYRQGSLAVYRLYDEESELGLFMMESKKENLLSGLSNIFAQRDLALARTEERLSRLGYKDKLETTIMNGITAYYQLLEAQNQRMIKRHSLETAKKSLTIMEKLVAGKFENEEKLFHCKSQVLEKENELFSIESDYIQKSAELLEFINEIEGGRHIALEKAPIEPRPILGNIDIAAIRTETLAKRFDYLSAEASLKKAEVNLAMQKSNSLPDLDLKGNYYMYGTSPDFNETFSKMELNYKQYNSSKDAFKLAQRNFDEATKLYEKGFMLLNKYLDHQNNREIAEFRMLKSRIQYTINHYKFLKARGILLESFGQK
ncbi:MAG: hypothetical protein GF401_04815 [Chitinivibrionales bacterium]|nr:hypothetical protein [Chitinivibrionales bacterium]